MIESAKRGSARKPGGEEESAVARRPLTVIVPTYNEEATLPECLESVRFADEILVVDSFSTDKTLRGNT